MHLSSKIKHLMLASIAILLLTFALLDSTKDLPKPSKPFAQGLTYPQVPRDLDPRALDYEIPRVPAPASPKNKQQVVISESQPTVSAEAYLVGNLETGQIYFEHEAHQVYPIASLSKLFTSLVVIHNMEPQLQVEITPSMLEAYGEAGHLEVGEKFTVTELLYPLLLESSNDAAEAIAQSYGYENFITEMNALVAQLKMPATSFRDPSGLSSRNVSNAQDLFRFARHLYQNEKQLLELTRQTSYYVASTTNHREHLWKTINPFPFDPHFIGGKTGRTIEAKESMVSLFKYNVGSASYPVAIIVLRSDFSVREVDSSVLFERFIKTVDSGI